MTSAVDLDFDVVVHFGHLENVDMSQTGIYIVQVSLFYGEDGIKIAPIGVFSAPSTLESHIDTQKVVVAASVQL